MLPLKVIIGELPNIEVFEICHVCEQILQELDLKFSFEELKVAFEN